MRIVIIILSIIVCIKTISYGVYEINQNKNRFGGIFVILFAIISSILPNIIVYIKGI